MKACLSTFAYIHYPLEEAITRTAKAGYDAVEIVANRPHMLPQDYIERDRRKVISTVAESGLKVAAVTSFNGTAHWLFTHPNKRVRDDTVSHVKDCLDLAVELEAPLVEVVTGTPVLIGTEDEQALEWARDCLAACADHAQSTRRLIGLEAEPGNAISSTDQAIAMIKEIGSPSIKILLDIGHVNVGGENPSVSIRKAKEYLAHVHIHDNDGSTDQHLIPGYGKIQFAPIERALREIGYNGYLSAELEQEEGDSAALETREFLRKVFKI